MKIKKCCANCSHVGAETTTDVACCNCCEDMEFYDELPADLCIEFEDEEDEEGIEDRYTLADLGWNWW